MSEEALQQRIEALELLLKVKDDSLKAMTAARDYWAYDHVDPDLVQRIEDLDDDGLREVRRTVSLAEERQRLISSLVEEKKIVSSLVGEMHLAELKIKELEDKG